METLKTISDQLEGAPLGYSDVLIYTPNFSVTDTEAKAIRHELALRYEWRGPLVLISNAKIGDFTVMPLDIAQKFYKLLHMRFGHEEKAKEGEGWKDGINIE